MDAHVLNLALPQLTADLRPTNAELLWIVDSYAFLVAGSLLTTGALGDRVGRRRMLLIGAGAFGAASLLAAFAPSAPVLIAARALLGIAGATLMPATLALIRVMFEDPRQRHHGVRDLDGELRAGRRDRPDRRRRPAAPTSGGARSSSSPFR